jgi:hypothetical protein
MLEGVQRTPRREIANMIEMPPLEYLNECFEIDSRCLSGLRWRLRPPHHFKRECDKTLNEKLAGAMAGCQNGNYFRIALNGQKLTAHRVIYAIHNNEIGDFLIDHIDRNPGNNHPDNLRKATTQENARNSKHRSNNTSGVKGVYWAKQKK